MKIKKIDHISLNISNIKESTYFYGNILGFKPLGTIPNGDNDITYFDIGDGSRIELFDNHMDLTSAYDKQIGYVHAAFQVDDVDEWAEYLKKHKVKITLEPCDLIHLNARVCLFVDPDGNTIEICYPLS